MTITEFLLARIEEDEAQAHMSAKMPDYCPTPDTSIELESWCVDCGAGNQMLIHATRVLAECAAKRAIVADATGWEHELDSSAWYACRAYKLKEDSWKVLKVSEGKCNCGVTARRNAIMKPLAAVYASHPDYRQEWAL